MRLDLHKNVDSKQILEAIGIKEEDIPRLRGVGIDDGKIIIHTRTGGGNRDDYEKENNALAKNKYYLSDEDVNKLDFVRVFTVGGKYTISVDNTVNI